MNKEETNNLEAYQDFIKKIKEKLKKEDYESFIKFISSYKGEIKFQNIYEELKKIFKKETVHSKHLKKVLFSELLNFLIFNPIKEKEIEVEVSKKEDSFDYEDSILEVFSNFKKEFSPEKYNEIIKCVNLYNIEIITKRDLLSLLEDLFDGKKELFASFQSILNEPVLNENNDFIENDVGPSYRMIPSDSILQPCSGRSELCKEVLNDYIESSSKGSEESKSLHKLNEEEEILFQCEDDRVELDIVIEQNESTIQFFNEVEKMLMEDKFLINDLDEYLSSIHKASISRVYHDKSNELINGLKKNPRVAVPILIERLNQKGEEWKSAKADLNKFWLEVYEKNNKKLFERKSNEIKFVEKRKYNEITILNDIKIFNKKDLDFECDFKDKSIHNDIYQVLVQISKSNEVPIYQDFYKFLIKFFNLNPKGFSLQEDEKESIKENNYVYGSDSLYLFFKVYHLLFTNLENIKIQSNFDQENLSSENLTFLLSKNSKLEKVDYYYYVYVLIDYLNKKIPQRVYENELLDIFGYNQNYVLNLDYLFSKFKKIV
jgi:hypothetical protein